MAHLLHLSNLRHINDINNNNNNKYNICFTVARTSLQQTTFSYMGDVTNDQKSDNIKGN